MINGIDEQGDEVKQEPQTTNPKNRYEEHSYNFYNNKQRIVKNNSKFYDIEGDEITDPDRVSDLNSISNVVGTTPYLQIKGVRYWLVNDSTVVKAEANGNYSVTHASAQIQKVKDKKAENEAKAKQKAAEKAAKAELERIKKEQKQKEQEELGVKQDNIDEEAELGAEQTYTEDMPFEETFELDYGTGKPIPIQKEQTPTEQPIVEKPKPLVDLSQSKEESRDLNSRLDEDITITIAGEEVSGTVYDIIAEHLMDEKTRNDDALADKRFNELMEEFKNSNLSLKDWLTKKINCG